MSFRREMRSEKKSKKETKSRRAREGKRKVKRKKVVFFFRVLLIEALEAFLFI